MKELENEIQVAAENEDYELADSLQTQIDEIQNIKIPNLQDELEDALCENAVIQETA